MGADTERPQNKEQDPRRKKYPKWWTGALKRSAVKQPTNYSMLLLRTVNRERHQPNANEDNIAPLFRNNLMPIRSWFFRQFPGTVTTFQLGVENEHAGVPGVCNFVDARTKWLDGAVQQALDAGITQVVAVAAGYDTRAYRFHRPGVKCFEVDLPKASKRKQKLVKSCLPGPDVLPRPVYIGADLSKMTLHDALGKTSFDSTKPTLFTLEGLIYYLPEDAVSRLLTSIASLAAPGSRVAFDFLHQDALDGSVPYVGYDNCAESCKLKNEPFVSAFKPEAGALRAYLEPRGFQLDALLGAQEMAAAQLPHLRWEKGALPPILTFYSYCEASVPANQADRDCVCKIAVGGAAVEAAEGAVKLGAEHLAHA